MRCVIAILMAIFGSGICYDPICQDAYAVVGEQKAAIFAKKEDGKWVTTISTQIESEGSLESPNLEACQKVLKCSGKEIVQITAVLREHGDLQGVSTLHIQHDKLLFNSIGGPNVRVINNGSTAFRIREDEIDKAGILTNRPLKDDEIFEVRLDKCLSKHGSNIGIGITNLTPTSITYSSWFSSGAIILYNNNVYGSQPRGNYGPNLRSLKVGTRLGAQRRKNGDVHFYVNGVDQGVAATGVAAPVYGVFDLYGDCVEGTIMHR